MGDQDGFNIEDVVGKVKAAVQDAGIGAAGADIVANKVELSLTVVRDRHAGVDAKWVVPIINLPLGIKADRKWSTTTTIDVTLISPAPKKKVGFGPPDVESELAQAIQLVRDSVKAGAAGQPPFDLDSGKVTIEFGVTSAGGLSLIAAADAESANTQKLTLTLSTPTSVK